MLSYLQQQEEDNPLIVLVLLDQRVGCVAVRPLTLAVGHSGIRHGLAEAHVEGVHHAVRGVKPAEGLQHDLVDGAAGFAVYGRAGDALTGESEATGQQHRHGGAIVQPKYHGILDDPVQLEERSNRAEQINHL